MKKRFFFCFVIGLLWAFCGAVLAAGQVRQARYQGIFYPASTRQLLQLIHELVRQGETAAREKIGTGRLKALIMPHAGYIYSGSTAGHGAALLRGRAFKKVIIMGPDHRIGFTGCAVSSATAWQTPLGRVTLHGNTQTLLKLPDLFHTQVDADRMEHSVEVILPFVQACLDDFTLVPVVAGLCDVEKTAPEIDDLIDEDTLVIVSSDLSHYLPYEAAVQKDWATIRMILSGNAEALQRADNAACGKRPILLLMDIAKRRNWRPRLLHYANSGDTTGEKSRVVGYGAIAYVAGEDSRISEEQGNILVQCARQALARRFGGGSKGETLSLPENSPLNREGATFVTLYLDGRLRGCIGSLRAVEPMVKNVERNALNAAFRDPRFPALTPEEFERITIEVSVLTPPRPLTYADGRDLVSKLYPGRDGVIIQKGGYRATFLPQVWDQLPKPEAFLSRLCQKAGLPADEWRKGHLEVHTYQVQHFSEGH